MNQTTELRSFHRTMVNSPVKITTNGSTCDAKCIDLSATGMMIEVNKMFTKNTPIDILLDLIDHPIPKMKIKGKVLRCTQIEQNIFRVAMVCV